MKPIGLKKQELILLDYDGIEVRLNEDGWFNATIASAKFNKRPNDWLFLDSTKEYIDALMRFLDFPDRTCLIKTKSGRPSLITRNPGNYGTWFHPKLAVPFARWLDVNFAIWCDIQIDKIVKGTHPHFDWKRVRHEATSSYKVMNAVLQLVRQNNGKPTQFFHYANEAKLVNWAITGEFKPLDRDGLNHEELDLLAKLEERNAVLVGCGLNREDRKLALSKFATEFKCPIMIESDANAWPI